MSNFPDMEYKSKEEPTIAIGADGNSLQLLQAIYRSVTLPLSTRTRAAIAALPFEFPKLAVTAQLNGDDFARSLELAQQRSAIARSLEPPKEIEHQSPLSLRRL